MTFEEDFIPKESKKSPLLTFLIALLLSSAPAIAAGVLLVIYPDYMAQFLYGPPEGAYVPGASVPLGLPIIGAIVLLTLIGFVVNLMLVRWVRKNKLPLRVIVTFAFLLFVNFIVQGLACILVILGPTGIQMYKEFF